LFDHPLEDFHRSPGQQGSYGSAADDEKLGRLNQNHQMAVFENITGYYRTSHNYQTQNREHKNPIVAVILLYSIIVILALFLKP
jgi:hypothetical protein